ncbi:N-acetylmuramoyl-L-alanine amidase family protein [Saccharicrinis fermentans]|uniref:N-acetylmuramoyl-L-alanine amidase n=1 Tax=Saccharicrinis fermentans DSM 9555 = JCM 21142 TaxID=869213 RepID=W7YH51_9BACT|nr:N-acetylmuramoyl-L-alanine amidase [Saccharicrinis fermentans]GAF03731.1 N-acetylmuramoyl-L-alanine amidase CwlD [Saccharicrinis fermentans DSM 9555 = JCM 21142]
MMIKRLLLLLITSTFLQVQAQEATNITFSTPKNGEGLHAFFKRNGLHSDELRAQFLKLNQSNLGKNNSLLMGVKYLIPETSTILHEPLYGKERAHFELESNTLKGAVFHLVSGHGGPDPGALGKYGNKTLSEDEYAYDITLRLAKKLQENGATVHMIIEDKNDGIRDHSYLESDKDETCMGQAIPLKQIDRLQQRTDAVNKLYLQFKGSYQRCVVIHVDSRSRGKEIDVFFYHAPKSKSGKAAAQSILQVFDKKYKEHQPSRGYSGIVNSRNLYLLRKTYPTAVFVELGNIRNYRDQQRFIIQNNRQALANWMYEGLLNDFNTQKQKKLN